MFQIWLKAFLGLKKLKTLCRVITDVISDLKGKNIVGRFYENELQKEIKKSLKLKK